MVDSNATWTAIFKYIKGATIENIIFKDVNSYSIFASTIAYQTIENNNTFSKVGVTR